MTVTSFAKREISLRYWLQGAGYFDALRAMEFGSRYHTGVRKDGVTPEWDHQVSIAHYVRTLAHSLIHPENTISVVFLHDVREDYGVSHEEIVSMFGVQVAQAVDAMTKTFRGHKRPEALVFEQIAADPIASIAKGADRIHNFNSMVGVFNTAKQLAYIQEAETWFMPMIKHARRLHVRQEPAYENIKTVLRSQINLIQAIHKEI
jgi:(p)ppGpp synthase/HD superfamily hydrolase